jgi:hypothetical protein
MTGQRQNGRRRALQAAAAGLGLFSLVASGQGLRFSNHRDVAVPDYATLRIGPFYSAVVFYQSVGWRYSYSYGAGTRFLYENRRGRVVSDGYEFPMISTLELRSYLLLTPTTDLDASVRVTYEHYPMKTQEDEFRVDLGEEGVFASLSSEFALTPFVKGRLYDEAAYRTDYIDTRGLQDVYGGSGYEHFENHLGLDMDWLMAADKNLAASASRRDVIPFTEEFRRQERVEYAESAEYQQTILRGLTAGGGARYTQINYEDTNQTRVTREDYDVSLDFGRGVGMRLGQSSTLGLGVGYSRGAAWSGNATNARSAQAVTGQAALRTDLTPKLQHTLSFARSLATDFNYPLVILDAYSYEIAFHGDVLAANAYSRLGVVDPVDRDWVGYRDWESGAGLGFPLVSIARFQGNAVYRVRENERRTYGPGDTTDDEMRYNYETFYARAAVAVPLTDDLSFEVYAEHVERMSTSDTLAYGRRFYGATLTYRHEF